MGSWKETLVDIALAVVALIVGGLLLVALIEIATSL